MKNIPLLKSLVSPINVFCTFCCQPFFFLRSQMNPVPKILPFILCSLFALVCVFLLPTRGWAWEVNTHKEITEQAIRIMEGDLNAYLIDNLGLDGGLNAAVKGGTPRELMIQGSNDEDNSPRFLNHFHNPISNAGITGPGESAINWSLRPQETQWLGEFWSWNDAREYYFKALTSETKADRDIYWAKAFRALGQVMHLLQDSANPSHVRDDLHAFDDGLHDYMEKRSVGSYVGSGVFSPDPSILEQGGSTRSEPFSNLFDRNVYTGSNPQATLGTDIGVTEFTNANFFSDDTIPGQGSIFSAEMRYPTVSELVPAPIPSPYLTLPRLGSVASPGARAAKLTGNQAVAKFLLTNTNLDLLGQLQLDDAVYEGQSINLIPRAVGYSAAVLTYFFRGNTPIGFTEYCFQPGFQSTPPTTSFSVDVEISIPDQFQDGGEFYSYVDRPDGQRENMSGFVWDSTRLGIPFAMGGGFVGDDWGHPGPQRVTIVYKGKLGPRGAEEPMGVVGKTYEITNFIEPCLQ